MSLFDWAEAHETTTIEAHEVTDPRTCKAAGCNGTLRCCTTEVYRCRTCGAYHRRNGELCEFVVTRTTNTKKRKGSR